MCVATEERKVVLKAREAAEYLRVSLFTLNKIERQGLLTPFRTPGGHRRYTLEMLNQLLEENRLPGDNPTENQERS
jgi:predicted site-specific integrase-resolvase